MIKGKNLPAHCSGLRTEVAEQYSPPPALIFMYALSYPLHDNDTYMKSQQKRSRSSKLTEESNNGTEIVKTDKLECAFYR